MTTSDSTADPVQSAADRVLVVLLGQTRAWELTAEGFMKNVLDELGADLALCGGDRDEGDNPFYERAKFVWRSPEPDDWAEVYDRVVGDSSWRVLLRPGENLFGGVKDERNPQVGVGALLLYVWRDLGEKLRREGLADAYDWLVVTRSDFLWPVPHPEVRHLSDRRVHMLDGEQYLGVSDRHFIVPRRLVDRFLQIPDPVFTEPQALAYRLDRRSAAQAWPFMNVERFFAARLAELGLSRRLGFLPYVPFLVRSEGGTTSWSVGEFDERLGFFVKYPTERERSEIAQEFISDPASWGRYLAPVRGLPARLRLRRAYRRRGLYERPFPIHLMPVRAARIARWSLPHWKLRIRAIAPRVGRVLRRVPGMQRLLDARVRRMERR